LNVIVYVEGEGDKACLGTLLRGLVDRLATAGTLVRFVPTKRGDRKATLLRDGPKNAAKMIVNAPDSFVVLLPDLYPPNKEFPHSTCSELQTRVRQMFEKEVAQKSDPDERLRGRFQAFCLIHDLECIVLAAEESLLSDRRLKTRDWTTPVEAQNHGNPPKRVVERIFHASGSTYDSRVDGPRILANADYKLIAERCPNGFGRFVTFLESFASESTLQ